ncbi:hypothetical protein [Paenibacillus aestuarii]|uniref:DUF4083 domain-containing protein n=1 Tax=Paenibacillus aestuarii TaxID=516965 RepID=A0ABW0K851_9BACL|nr:hypothetical protein [Paenibacillus aestuarii]
MSMSHSFFLFSWLTMVYYFLLAIGGPVFIVWMAISYLKVMRERNRLLRELVDKMNKSTQG